MTYEQLVALALEFPETEESPYYGDPAVKRGGKLMFAMSKEPGEVLFKMDWSNRDRYLADYHDVIRIKPSLHGWPGFLVRLDRLPSDLGLNLVKASYHDAPKPARRRDTP